MHGNIKAQRLFSFLKIVIIYLDRDKLNIDNIFFNHLLPIRFYTSLKWVKRTISKKKMKWFETYEILTFILGNVRVLLERFFLTSQIVYLMMKAQLDPSSIEKSRKKWSKKFDRSFWFHYLWLFVCLSRSTGHSFCRRKLIFWHEEPLSEIQKTFFLFLRFWDLTYLYLFIDFLVVFCYISSVKFERVCRLN